MSVDHDRAGVDPSLFCRRCGALGSMCRCTEDEDGSLREAIEAALRTDVYADTERFHEMRDEDFAAWMKRGTNSAKVAPWAQDIDRLLRQVRGVRAALRADSRVGITSVQHDPVGPESA